MNVLRPSEESVLHFEYRLDRETRNTTANPEANHISYNMLPLDSAASRKFLAAHLNQLGHRLKH
ncbi:uncharacterized protein FOMMEDRAFT_19040 [Fomitiporia mediterranea MF3/22]|uniref:uncharacterized protein n=1 Tax=Fomitiporia mediterranea (strain MF3/22) TaxID=694068 RepID=UPI0004407D0C|nr:uncharacterized protein FOMMEDRAFT_19040 [Fomitiporia mediterranea MF3/22]EJD03650.1 hypothetical protein FOMMEDRAFT_19040 [Fomitiporia mediterranea MF3/22]